MCSLSFFAQYNVSSSSESQTDIVLFGNAIWLKFCFVIYTECNTNQYESSADSVINMQQEAICIWHIFFFCNISDKYSTNIWHLFLLLNICNKDQYGEHIMSALNC